MKNDESNPPKDEWIRVEDGLPESSKYVLTYNGKDDIDTGYYYRGQWYSSNKNIVTHWQPLPKAPKQ